MGSNIIHSLQGICLCLYFGVVSLSSTVNCGFTFPDSSQGQFASSLADYDITFPSLVSEKGSFLSHAVHRILPPGSRKKRDASQQNIFYNVSVDGMDLHVGLEPNHGMFAPGLLVERRKSGHGNLSDATLTRIEDNKCHFIGRMKNHPDSVAALATCYGLHGLLRTSKGDYFIEPVKGHDKDSGLQHPHLIYKKNAIPKHLHPQHHHNHLASCGVKDGEDPEVAREKWEAENRGNFREKGRRHKRSVSLERNVETLVVIDQKMVHYYRNEDIETYVLTIFNMVSTMYHDSSIGNAVNVALVKIMLLEEEEKDLKITHHADNTLESFCKWQMTVNPKDEKHANHHDVAILLTRYNICSKMNEPCSTLGLSQVSGLCQPHRSCNINEDTGLALAYTVAHELGHNFAMQHDSPVNGCQVKGDGPLHVMSPQLNAEASPLIWSNCSRRSISSFLDRDWGYCLDDEPTPVDPEFQFPVLPPGVMYDADHQCRLQYGPDATYCEGIDEVCMTLWCRVDNKCVTRLEAAAQGTICDNNKWCFAGQCVDIGEKPQAINGEWGVWGEWTSCSRTCGAGVSFAERHCDNPPPSNGGKYCLGERKRYRICNIEDCPDEEDAPSFREVQCAEFDTIPYKRALYRWEPVATPLTPCQLHCKPRGRFFSVMLRDMVADGTPCKPGRKDMCISGRCRTIGCDWKIDSAAKEDRCGVCHGDGSTCKTVKNEFNEKLGLGYVEAMVIPAGARNIRVEEVAEANNYLAVKNDQGKYYLNGYWFIQWSGDYEAAGTTLHYQRDGNKEKFLAPGPLKEPLHIMLLFQSSNPGVIFEFTVPNANVTSERRMVYKWKYMDWTHCTSSCGGGTQRSEVVCVEMEAGTIVENHFCNQTTKPDDMQKSCNEQPCPARWWVGPWQHCSVTCGYNGSHKRTVLCVRSHGPNHQVALEDFECATIKKPAEVEPCRRKKPCAELAAFWKTGPWSDTCGGDPCALQTRRVKCSDHVSTCDKSSQPDTKRYCSNSTCGQWQIASWSKCTRSCGGGIQFRIVSCTGGKACPSSLEPPSERKCNEHGCLMPTSQTYIDVVSPAVHSTALPSPTSMSKNTTPSAYNASHPFTTPILSTHNASNLMSPSDSQEVVSSLVTISNGLSTANETLQNKHHHWKNWHKSLKEPGSGMRKGQKMAAHEINNEKVQSTIPTTTLRSGIDENMVPYNKNHRWMPLVWGECSKECGDSEKSREITCVNINSLSEVSPRFCKGLKMPAVKAPCKADPCFMWHLGDWQQCTKTCGTGVQTRKVICPEHNKCDPDKRPSMSRSCPNLPQCTEWVTGPWSQCTRSCGGGNQMRHVQCVDTGTQRPAYGCNTLTQPTTSQNCGEDKCPKQTGALTGFDPKCKADVMSFPVCKSLQRMGQCAQRYVQLKCCRTCQHSRHKGKRGGSKS